MKNIWIAVLVVISFVFVPRINAKDAGVSPNDGWPTKEEIKKIAEDKSIETIRVPKGTFKPEAMPEKKPKFSVSVGMGSSFGLGEKDAGILNYYKNSPASSVRIGYYLCKYVEVQGEYSFGTKFKGKSDGQKISHAYSIYSLNLKAGVPIRIKKVGFYPYIVTGFGKANTNNKWAAATWSDSNKGKNEKFSKIGMGIETRLYKNTFLFSELSRQKIEDSISFDRRLLYYYKQIQIGLSLKL